MTGMGSKEELLCIMDGRASYCVYATNNRMVQFGFFLSFFLSCSSVGSEYTRQQSVGVNTLGSRVYTLGSRVLE